jgi:hypothetical protein
LRSETFVVFAAYIAVNSARTAYDDTLRDFSAPPYVLNRQRTFEY